MECFLCREFAFISNYTAVCRVVGAVRRRSVRVRVEFCALTADGRHLALRNEF